jgi:hypothetical protein
MAQTMVQVPQLANEAAVRLQRLQRSRTARSAPYDSSSPGLSHLASPQGGGEAKEQRLYSPNTIVVRDAAHHSAASQDADPPATPAKNTVGSADGDSGGMSPKRRALPGHVRAKLP